MTGDAWFSSQATARNPRGSRRKVATTTAPSSAALQRRTDTKEQAATHENEHTMAEEKAERRLAVAVLRFDDRNRYDRRHHDAPHIRRPLPPPPSPPRASPPPPSPCPLPSINLDGRFSAAAADDRCCRVYRRRHRRWQLPPLAAADIAGSAALTEHRHRHSHLQDMERTASRPRCFLAVVRSASSTARRRPR